MGVVMELRPCIACHRSCNTRMAADGSMEWHTAILMNLGLPENEAAVTIEYMVNESKHKLPGLAIYVVCSKCAGKKFSVSADLQALPLFKEPSADEMEAWELSHPDQPLPDGAHRIKGWTD